MGSSESSKNSKSSPKNTEEKTTSIEQHEKRDKVHPGVDILVTHTPPFCVGDCLDSQEDAGCPHLLSAIQDRVKPKAHVFGHVHVPGVWSDSQTTYVNAAIVDEDYTPNNFSKPIVIDIELDDEADFENDSIYEI